METERMIFEGYPELINQDERRFYKEYPEKHKRILCKEDCNCCNMRQTYFCKELCINALSEK
jgi:hypothetical protein